VEVAGDGTVAKLKKAARLAAGVSVGVSTLCLRRITPEGDAAEVLDDNAYLSALGVGEGSRVRLEARKGGDQQEMMRVDAFRYIGPPSNVAVTEEEWAAADAYSAKRRDTAEDDHIPPPPVGAFSIHSPVLFSHPDKGRRDGEAEAAAHQRDFYETIGGFDVPRNAPASVLKSTLAARLETTPENMRLWSGGRLIRSDTQSFRKQGGGGVVVVQVFDAPQTTMESDRVPVVLYRRLSPSVAPPRGRFELVGTVGVGRGGRVMSTDLCGAIPEGEREGCRVWKYSPSQDVWIALVPVDADPSSNLRSKPWGLRDGDIVVYANDVEDRFTDCWDPSLPRRSQAHGTARDEIGRPAVAVTRGPEVAIRIQLDDDF